MYNYKNVIDWTENWRYIAWVKLDNAYLSEQKKPILNK
jgi:hypothetical protein